VLWYRIDMKGFHTVSMVAPGPVGSRFSVPDKSHGRFVVVLALKWATQNRNFLPPVSLYHSSAVTTESASRPSRSAASSDVVGL